MGSVAGRRLPLAHFGFHGVEALEDRVDGVAAEDESKRRVGSVECGEDRAGGFGGVAWLASVAG